MVRDDGLQEIDFDWGLSGPSKDCNVNIDEFSVRWTRTVAFAGGAYRFAITADDGVRLFIDGQEKFSEWRNRALTTSIVDIAISPGNHKIVLEYFENYGSAVVKLSWKQHPCISTAPPDHWRGEYFNNENLSGQPVMVRDDGGQSLGFDWRESPDQACAGFTDNFSVRWTRRTAFGQGLYHFNISSDAGARLYIDGQLRFDKWRGQSQINENLDLQMEAGNHLIVFEYRTSAGRSIAAVRWKPLPCLDNVPEDHWRGEYFNSDNLSGQPVMVRDDGDGLGGIDFNWSDGSPSAGCNVREDSFSVRWTGSPSLEKGFHRFTVAALGGVRLRIDGQLKIDQWVPKNQKLSVDVELDAGRHKITLEYADFGGKASVKLTRQPPPCIAAVPADHWRGEYFNNKDLSGRPSIVRDDGVGMINFDWKLDTPNRDCFESVDGFSARWSRTVNFAAGSYRFTIAADDGVRLFVDGQKLIDEWRDQFAGTYTVDLELSGGPHRIALEFYENFGSAAVKLSWTTTPCTAILPAERWKGEVFNNLDLSGKPALTRDDGEGPLNFDWELKSPDSNCGVNIDNFSARWTRSVTFGAGIFRFTVAADDGVRVYIDKQLKFERWIDQMTTHTFDVQLSAGNHLITVEYYERWGSAIFKLSWEEHPCFPTVPSDHWRGEYFNNAILSGGPVMIRDDGEGYLNFNWDAKSPNSGCNVNTDDFSVRWMRKLIIPGGLYRFTVTGDDGVRFFVNGRKLIDEWRNQSQTTFNATVYLRPGSHRIVFEFYDHTGAAVVNLSWQQIGGVRAP